MKRAIFKIGNSCIIETKSGKDSYEVEISSKWISDENDWLIPVKAVNNSSKPDGTRIHITKLHEGIALQFGHDKASFISEFTKRVSTHYAMIITKGFSVIINGVHVAPKPIKLIFSETIRGKDGIRPFFYRATVDNVKIFMAVGFTRPIPSIDEAISEQEEVKYTSIDAGWTVVCNDRAVLYCDKSELTGWGEAGVPQYHNQFIAISGIVEFLSDDPSKLPTTTTKRGIDASSQLYLRVKNKMREGMKLFTDYTNKWKSDVKKSKEHIRNADTLTFEELKKEARKISTSFSAVRSSIKGDQYKPSLPMPERQPSTKRRIAYTKDISDIRVVGKYLLQDSDADPSVVGERCFDFILTGAKK